MRLSTVKRAWVYFCVNHILVGTRFFSWKRRLLQSVGHEIGENTKVVGPIFCTGKLCIGSNCWIGRKLEINGNGTVEIGDNCDIAPGVVFITGGHAIGDCLRRAGKGESYTIHVGSGTWVCAGVTIAGTVNIGESSVIAACACVVSDVPANTLFGGVPAKKIREL